MDPRVQYRVNALCENQSGGYASETRIFQTLWKAIQWAVEVLDAGGSVRSMDREVVGIEPLTEKERNTVTMLTQGRVRF